MRPIESQPESGPQSSLGTAARVCGIVGIPVAVLISVAGFVLGVVAIVFGAIARTSARRAGRKVRRNGILLGVIAVLLAIVVTYGFWGAFIPSTNMAPTMDVGDRVVAERLSYLASGPQRGDIILFQDPNSAAVSRNVVEEWLTGGLLFVTARVPEQTLINRVIAVAGDEIEIRDGRVFIDGEVFDEPPGVRPDHSTFGPVTVQAGHLFVMGDNRANSADSRSLLGQIPEERIVARVFLVV